MLLAELPLFGSLLWVVTTTLIISLCFDHLSGVGRYRRNSKKFVITATAPRMVPKLPMDHGRH